MAPKFGSYLFRNLKGQTTDPNPPGNSLGAFGAFEEQPILLRREDIQVDDPKAPPLDWSKIEKGQIAVQLKDTQGIMDGCVTIKASTLHRIYPSLLQPFEGDYSFPVSLKAVVLQLQAHLQSKLADGSKTGGPDYDTPIAQVAREDEGFFKLEKVAQQSPPPAEKPQAKPASTEPLLTPADHPNFPPIREKPQEAQSEVPPLEITLQQPVSQKSRPAPPTRLERGPFDQLPKVGPEFSRTKGSEASEVRPVKQEKEKDFVGQELPKRFPASGLHVDKPPRRAGLELLQEIFMTEDLLDAREVASLITHYPKVGGALILLNDGTVMGGSLPKEFQAEAAVLATSVMQTVQEFGRRLKTREACAVTIFLDQPVSLCSAGNICILIAHEGRGLLPGMRDRICEVARALDLLYGQGANSSS
jgi:hypothetical protein